MSDGNFYGLDWQKPVGWLGGVVPLVSAKPLLEIAKKLAYYMGEASHEEYFDRSEARVPHDRFYRLDGGRGPHNCEIRPCQMDMSGVFGFRKWKFPTGIIHYILDHNYLPPAEFLAELAELPDPPDNVAVPVWCTPNLRGLFQANRSATR